MLEYDRIDISEGIAINKTNASKECKNTENTDLTYYQRNREVMLNRAKDYYKNDKEKLREQARNKYRNLFEKDKNKKRIWEE